jgi:hypothetical protein
VEVIEVTQTTPDITKKVENLKYEASKPDMMKGMVALNSILRTSHNVRKEKDVHKAILYIGRDVMHVVHWNPSGPIQASKMLF